MSETAPVIIQAYLSINGSLSDPLGTITLGERGTAAWETAALLREIADQVETHQRPIVIGWN